MGGMKPSIEEINTINRSVNIVNRFLLIDPKIAFGLKLNCNQECVKID